MILNEDEDNYDDDVKHYIITFPTHVYNHTTALHKPQTTNTATTATLLQATGTQRQQANHLSDSCNRECLSV